MRICVGCKPNLLSKFDLLNKRISCVYQEKCAKRPLTCNLDAKTQQRLPNVRSLGSADELFVENVHRDVRRFLKRYTKNCVLIFPPVSSFHRFLIHQTCESVSQEYDLCTFSVGQGYYRRTVVCFRSQILDPSKLTTNQAPSTSSETRYQKSLDNWRSTSVNSSAQAKSSYDRWNCGQRMGVGNNLNENREHKLHSMHRQQPIPSRNRYELSEKAETPSTQASMHRKLPTTDTRVTNTEISCNSSPIRTNETESSESTVTAQDDSGTTTAAATTTNAAIPSLAGDQQSKVQTARRERRPDRAVYVPRARRSQTTPPTTTATATATTMTTNTATIATNTIGSNRNGGSAASSSNHQKSNTIILGANVSEAVSTATLAKVDETTKKSKSKTGNSFNPTLVTSSLASTTIAGNHGKERRIERHRKSLEKSKSSNNKKELVTVTESSYIKNKTSSKEQDCDTQKQQQQQHKENNHQGAFASNILTEPPIKSRATTDIIVKTNEMNSTKNKSLNKLPPSPLSASMVQNGLDDPSKIALPVHKVSHMFIEEIASNGQASPSKCDIDEQELQRASKEINRSNRRIMKQTFVSDVLEIPDKIEHSHVVYAKAAISSPTSTTFDSTTEDEEDDWESKYDESGDCLDPRILEELESAVGKVKITTPKADYSAFLTNQAILNDEEFPHVLEVSNFPVEFKNQDLLMVFSQYKESGFDIKWVDDTHALAVFSSSRIAAEVLTMGHPFVVLKPLAEATLESRLKAKKCASSLQPYRQRPETCAALARRLVTGALGVRLETAAAERENEKRVLRKAKERKLLAAKQRDEAWES